jgi:hypothetical protein
MQIQYIMILAYPLLFFNTMETHLRDKMTLEGGGEKRRVGGNLVTIEGIVIPVDWDEKGNMVALAVSTYLEDEYLIDQDEKGEELRAFIRQQVKVSGEVRKKGGKKIIKVEDHNLKKE